MSRNDMVVQMLTKFESKSNRVKGIAFHPTLTLLAASLHSGSVQLWNYQMGVLIDRFEEHDGPVRAVCFHETQPLLCSGGDDYKIRVWNFKTRKCLFTLHGHLDYIRTVAFHKEQPWILSCSDDQTIRIWNWQSRQCIAVLTGHNHYIMCAQFHPTQDLVVSASMDQTVRVWDISGLRKRSTSAQPLSFEEQVQRANAGSTNADMFGVFDTALKYVLEGHERGVNWAAFHPHLPLIVSCGDDRLIKLWRMGETKAWEVDTCRGHTNNINAVMFHPTLECILSVSEDRTIRVWDLSRRVAIQTFRREHDRFWTLASHPHQNMFATGHDTGLIVFKLTRERPAFTIYGNTLFYVRDRLLRAHDFTTGSDVSVANLRRLGSQYMVPRSISYNHAEYSAVVVYPKTSVDRKFSSYDITRFQRDTNVDELDNAASGAPVLGGDNCAAAFWIARNRFANLDYAEQTIEIRDLSNRITRTIATPPGTTDMFRHSGSSSLLLVNPTSVLVFDLQQEKVLAELPAHAIKYAVWSADNQMVALMSKHSITFATKTLQQTGTIHETIRIKSGIWDDNGVFVYTTLNHVKYALPIGGDSGIIKTMDQPVYLARMRGNTLHYLKRDGFPHSVQVDSTEYMFKLALSRRNFDEVLKIIRNANLLGQSIIAYLQKKGYSEISLHFVQDPETKFDLAVECGALDTALECARALDRPHTWTALAQVALKFGQYKIAETAWQKTRAFDDLSFLYLLSGADDRLAKMGTIAEKRGAHMSFLQNALLTKNYSAQTSLLSNAGLASLAYLTAQSFGDASLQDSLAQLAPPDADAAQLPQVSDGSQLGCVPVVPPSEAPPLRHWPLAKTESYFDQSLKSVVEGQLTAEDLERETAEREDELEGPDADKFVDLPAAEEDDGAFLGDEAIEPIDADVEEQWDLGAGGDTADDLGPAPLDPAELENLSEVDLWTHNSRWAGDHAIAGSFDTTMNILRAQVGALDFTLLKPYFIHLYSMSHVFLPASASLPPLPVPLRRPSELLLPATGLTFSLVSAQLRNAYTLFQRAKFSEARETFAELLRSLLFVVPADDEVEDMLELVAICREYLIGIDLELERRSLVEQDKVDAAAWEAQNPPPADDAPKPVPPVNQASQKRQLELAAYLTQCHLQPQHRILVLRMTMSAFAKVRNFATAAVFANRLLDLQPSPQVQSQARSVINQKSKFPRDTLLVDYDPDAHFEICPASLTPLYDTADFVVDPYTLAHYKPEFAGQVCRLSGVSEIGFEASGFMSDRY